MKTIYAVVCETEKTQKKQEREFISLCGLFKDLKKAQEAMLFWEEGKVPGVTYNIHNIVTDLVED